jgi:uncharacterized protein (TIGR00255 family)
LLLSMTGFGEARRQENGLSIAVEVRTINSRYFKIAIRTGEGQAALEPQIEGLVRERIKRGTVQVNLRVDRPASPDAYRINTPALLAYWKQLNELPSQWNLPRPTALETLLTLPGVVNEDVMPSGNAQEDWPLVSAVLASAMDNLARMREDEGRAMANDLRLNCQAIAAELEQIASRAPLTIDAYRARLEERLKKILAEHDIALDPADIIREISIFAERSDISEEIVRLRSHLEQFETILELKESSGRKLEFLTQEIFRETNTIGSKSTDIEVARHVIEIKTAVERLREMIQNVE